MPYDIHRAAYFDVQHQPRSAIRWGLRTGFSPNPHCPIPCHRIICSMWSSAVNYAVRCDATTGALSTVRSSSSCFFFFMIDLLPLYSPPHTHPPPASRPQPPVPATITASATKNHHQQQNKCYNAEKAAAAAAAGQKAS